MICGCGISTWGERWRELKCCNVQYCKLHIGYLLSLGCSASTSDWGLAWRRNGSAWPTCFGPRTRPRRPTVAAYWARIPSKVAGLAYVGVPCFPSGLICNKLNLSPLMSVDMVCTLPYHPRFWRPLIQRGKRAWDCDRLVRILHTYE
jgi:hypothetical protein